MGGNLSIHLSHEQRSPTSTTQTYILLYFNFFHIHFRRDSPPPTKWPRFCSSVWQCHCWCWSSSFSMRVNRLLWHLHRSQYFYTYFYLVTTTKTEMWAAVALFLPKFLQVKHGSLGQPAISSRAPQGLLHSILSYEFGNKHHFLPDWFQLVRTVRLTPAPPRHLFQILHLAFTSLCAYYHTAPWQRLKIHLGTHKENK